MIKNILDGSNYGNYLDLVSRTDQVYFKIQSKLNGFRITSDISEKQYQVLNKKIENLNNNKFISILGDSLKIAEQLNQMNINTKFDLITIGQALHWIDFDQLMKYILSDFLAPNGSIGVSSYIAEEIYLDVDELERLENRVIENKLELKYSLSLYQTQFYNEVKCNHFQIIQNILTVIVIVTIQHQDISNIILSYVEFKEQNEFTPQTFEQVIGYLKTYSAYNMYLFRFPERKDPIITFSHTLMDKYREIAKKNNFKTQYPPLVLYNKFFSSFVKEMNNI